MTGYSPAVCSELFFSHLSAVKECSGDSCLPGSCLTKENLKEKKKFQMTSEAARLLQCIKERATFLNRAVCSLSLPFPHSHGTEMETEELKYPSFSTLSRGWEISQLTLWKGSERLLSSFGCTGFPVVAPYVIFSALPLSTSVVHTDIHTWVVRVCLCPLQGCIPCLFSFWIFCV